MASKFRCEDCGDLDHVLMNGYWFGDRILEDVLFICRIVKSKIAVAVTDEAKGYFQTLNQKKWMTEARRYANREGADDFICPKCEEGGGMVAVVE